MKISHFSKLFLLLLTALTGCCCFTACQGTAANTAQYHDYQLFQMDTVIDIRLSGSESMVDAEYEEIRQQCAKKIEDIEGVLSRTIETSPVYEFNQPIQVMLDPDREMLEVLETALRISSLTGGAYAPTLGTLTELWNIPYRDSVPAQGEIAEALSHTSGDTLTISEVAVTKSDPAVKIDLGGIGKGYAAQEVLSYLDGTSLSCGLLSMGGNVGVFGEKEDGTPFKIGIRDPDDPNAVVGYLYIRAGFVSVSGDYERYVEIAGTRYHHIFDPATGMPADSGLRSVAVHCNNGAVADALSTALFVMGAKGGMEFYKSGAIPFEAVFVTATGELIVTDGLRDSALFEAVGEAYRLNTQG